MTGQKPGDHRRRRTAGHKPGSTGSGVPPLPRITVEMPVLVVGSGLVDFENLGPRVNGLRRPAGLHLTLLHLGILADFAADVSAWTKGITDPAMVSLRTAAWLRSLPVLPGFSGTAGKLVVFGGGRVTALEVDVPEQVHDFQRTLVEGLHVLLDDLLVDNVDDFILASPALGFRYPRWMPHVAVGRPLDRHTVTQEIDPLSVAFGPSQIRNGRFLPEPEMG
jgi:hypothetical protein